MKVLSSKWNSGIEKVSSSRGRIRTRRRRKNEIKFLILFFGGNKLEFKAIQFIKKAHLKISQLPIYNNLL
jgi:hypothetical protein